LTNDDGWDAPGLEALRQAAAALGECRIVAPMGPHSGCAHRVTTDRPIRVVEHPGETIAVEGTPPDCVRLALHHLAPEVSWVLSGINAGGNLGTDVHHSGTVAAVREAVVHGRPGIALSHYIARGRAIDWARAARWTARVLDDLLGRPWLPGTYWNVNLPHPEPGGPEPSVVFCPLDPSPLPLQYRIEGDSSRYCGDYQARARQPGSDVAVCFEGQIAVTRIRLERPQGDPGLAFEGGEPA
jgi:5'-nucleotidase